MLVTTNPQRTLWEALLPPGYEGLPPRLARVDALLDDPVFVEPYRAHFSAALGRPSIPIETYLRMMFLKHTYRLGYESLCREVADSLTWLRFCRIPLGTPVPHPSTLGKLTKRCGAAIVTELNEALLAKANEAKVVKTGQIRADTTVVAANVTYPTDSGLLVRAITLLVGLVTRIHALGAARRASEATERRRQGGRVAHHRRAGRLRRHHDRRRDPGAGQHPSPPQQLPGHRDPRVDRTDRLAKHRDRAGVAGAHPDPDPADRRAAAVSDPAGLDARPGRPTRRERPARQAGRVRLQGAGHRQPGRDRARPQPARRQPGRRAAARPRHQAGRRAAGGRAGGGDRRPRLAKPPSRATSPTSGCARSRSPVKANRPSAGAKPKRNLRFQRLVKWRTGCEGRIPYLKHRFRWDRTRFEGHDGAQTWCGLGVFAHNGIKIAALLGSHTADPTNPPATTQPAQAAGPPG